jgi:hypothetical protein
MQQKHLRSLSSQYDPISGEFVTQTGQGRVTMQSVNADGDLEVTCMDFSGKKIGYSTLLCVY